MKTICFFKELLLYYDSPQLFVVQNKVGTNYICMLVEQKEDLDKFICVEISDQRLNSLKRGSIDLKKVFEYPEIARFFTLSLNSYEINEIVLLPFNSNTLPEDWLPEDGLFLVQPPAEHEIVKESIEHSRTIVHLSLEVEEYTHTKSKIETVKLSDALLRFQTLIKYAYKRSIASLSPKKRKELNKSKNYMLDVYAFSPGSFKVKMESKSRPNLFGQTEVIRALSLIDKIVKNLDNIDAVLAILAENKGHFASTFINLLKYVIDSNSISYSWAYPTITKPISYKISKENAIKIYEKLTYEEELKEELVEIIGYFDKVDEKYGRWRLIDQNGNVYSGTLDESKEISLKGIVIGIKLYKLICIEKILELTGTGEEKKSLQLQEVEEVK